MPESHLNPATSRDDSTNTAHPKRDGLDDTHVGEAYHRKQSHGAHRTDHDAQLSTEDTKTSALPSPGESNYAAAASYPPQRRELRVELPDHDPVITPGTAAALLRLILNAARHQAGGQQPPPSRSTG